MKIVEALIVMPLTISILAGLISFDTSAVYELSSNVCEHQKELAKYYEKKESTKLKAAFKIEEATWK